MRKIGKNVKIVEILRPVARKLYVTGNSLPITWQTLAVRPQAESSEAYCPSPDPS